MRVPSQQSRWKFFVSGMVVALSMLALPRPAEAECVRCDRFDFLCCDVPADGRFVLTSFTGGESMACGGRADGTWYYSTSWPRWHCGARLRIENPENGACVVVEVADAGPADWVEERAGMPIIDASTLVCEELFGSSSCGWSDHFVIEVTQVDDDTPTGPEGCTGPGPGPADEGWPDVALDLAIPPPAGMGEDFCRLEGSEGVPDLWVGDGTSGRLEVENRGDGTAHGVMVTLETSSPALALASWSAEDVAGSPWPADGPDPGTHDRSLTVGLGTIPPGARAIVIARVEARNVTFPVEAPARLRAFVNSIDGAYEKPSFDATPTNVEGRQSWNGGDLRLAVERDVIGEERCDGQDQDCDGVEDEDWPELGQSCLVGEGACASEGIWACSTDGRGVRCDAPTLPDCPDPVEEDPPGDDSSESFPPGGEGGSEGEDGSSSGSGYPTSLVDVPGLQGGAGCSAASAAPVARSWLASVLAAVFR